MMYFSATQSTFPGEAQESPAIIAKTLPGQMKCDTMLRVLLTLTPWLATQTVACPYCIPHVAVVSVGHRVRKVMPRVASPKAPPSSADFAIKHEKKQDVPVKPARLLLRREDAWRSVAAIPPDLDLASDDISDARLEQKQTDAAGMEWTIEAPITFSYRVREEPDILDPSSDALIFGHLAGDDAALARAKARQPKRVVVVDEQVAELYGDRIEEYFAHHNVLTKLLVLPTTEENKDMDMVLTIAEAIHELGIDRRLDPVIAIGGGVCMDIVGFAASIYRRRTPYIRVPTTLMGYVDASIGAKTGVNFSGKKNKLGAYLPPALTLLDKSFLATLDQRQLSNGAAEIAKMALVKDPELFRLLCDHGEELISNCFQDIPQPDGSPSSAASRVLFLSVQTMLEELAPNLWEDSLERLVDFGHVFSMEIEMKALFDEKLFHGEAVAIDMAFSACLARVRGHISDPILDDILGMLRGLQLPVYHPDFDEALVNEAMYERVKFSSGQKIPLPVGAGVARIFNDISKKELLLALRLWQSRCKDLIEA